MQIIVSTRECRQSVLKINVTGCYKRFLRAQCVFVKVGVVRLQPNKLKTHQLLQYGLHTLYTHRDRAIVLALFYMLNLLLEPTFSLTFSVGIAEWDFYANSFL